MELISMKIDRLLEGYRSKNFTISDVLEQVSKRIENESSNPIWISLVPKKELNQRARQLENFNIDELPLYGIPFAVKDNIDSLLLPTTAACPDFSYIPTKNSLVVQKLINAGAVLIGKTNMDQFATGLVGTRSPYGACQNAHNPEYISGGSSAGSAVATALGQVSFALGTDTAGSGRVPAALNNIVGLKPTIGRISTSGIVPACSSLDCVSIFTLTSKDAHTVFNVATEDNNTSIAKGNSTPPKLQEKTNSAASFVFAVPQSEHLNFFENKSFQLLFDESLDFMTALGGTRIDCDFSPFLKIARLLYDGPWVAERYAAIGHFLEESPNSLLPVTKGIIGSGKSYSAADLFRAQDQLRILERECYKIWEMADVLITPTVGTTYRISEIASNPNTLNTNLGYYTNFVNLLDLCAVAVPTGFSDHNLPFGITLAAPPNSDEVLLSLASRIHSKAELPPGTKETSFPCCDALETNPANRFVDIAVCGAHMRNLPLNFQLTDIGGKYLETRKTIDKYRLYALPGGPPHRPGLIKAQPGASIEVEIWRLSKAGFGDFVSKIPSPLGIGQVELDNGDQVCGFLCEAYAIRDARDITEFGTWRKFITQTESP